MMRKIAIPCWIAIAMTSLPASAATIKILGSDSETGLLTHVGYTLKTIGNDSIGNQSGFTPDSGKSNLVTSTDVDYTNYLSSLPGGSTLTGATLDFSGLFSELRTSSSVNVGTFFYQPAFSSVLGAYTVTISSTLANVSLSGSSAVGYNLWTLFSSDLLAGHQIDVKWSAVDTFGVNTSSYGNDCKNCTEQFQVTSKGNFTASSASNGLNLTYSAGIASVPEPATMSLAGLVLIGLGFAGRRKRV